jgi:hypothetical protein
MSPDALLIERSIVLLERLAAEFASEVAGTPRRALGRDEVLRTRKEALLTISVLIPKLKAARPAAAPATLQTSCPSCEGD